ncbi:MAG: DNA polymerase III subunit delta' [Candidatus Omnitrophota bacterium]
MMMAENLVSQDIVDRFVKLLASKRLAHAYLFVGPKRIGKSETALSVAKLVNCERPSKEGFCDGCSSCLKIKNQRHPDVHIVAKEEASIKIEDIREVMTQSQLRSFEAKEKVFIITEVERLTLEASNALLKTLEEPTNNTLILLTTSALDRVLDTIKSRCQILYFFPLSHEEMEKNFSLKEHVSETEAHFLASFSEGCPGRIAPGEHSQVLERRNEAIDQFIFSDNDDVYLKKILADEAQTAQMIHFLFCWFKDLMLLKTNITKAHLVNADRLSDLQRSSGHYSFEELEDILEDLVAARKALEGNFNVKIALAILKEKTWKK